MEDNEVGFLRHLQIIVFQQYVLPSFYCVLGRQPLAEYVGPTVLHTVPQLLHPVRLARYFFLFTRVIPQYVAINILKPLVVFVDHLPRVARCPERP